MERITRVQLNSALTTTGAQLQKRLPSEELEALGIILNRMAKRYPSQDLKDSMEEFLNDLEQLALKYSLQRFEEPLWQGR